MGTIFVSIMILSAIPTASVSSGTLSESPSTGNGDTITVTMTVNNIGAASAINVAPSSLTVSGKDTTTDSSTLTGKDVTTDSSTTTETDTGVALDGSTTTGKDVTTDTSISSGTGSATLASGPEPLSATIAAGGSQTFTWTYTAVSAGTIQFSGSASGSDEYSEKTVSTGVLSSDVIKIQIPPPPVHRAVLIYYNLSLISWIVHAK